MNSQVSIQKPTPYRLRSYQQEAVERSLAYFRKSREPAVLVLPTGAGKSLVIAELARVARGRVLVLAHVKELVEQNYEKYVSYGLCAGIFSASLKRKDKTQKVIFGSIQSIARAGESFFADFNLLVIDECHRVAMESETQYQSVIQSLREANPKLCILGLTATPYRLGAGWIYNIHMSGEQKTKEPRFFKHCVYELDLKYMIQNRYLTPPVKLDIPVTSYDFSDLFETQKAYTQAEIERVLKQQKRLTPLIIKNIIDIAESYGRRGVMIFAATVSHAKEILSYLPEGEAALVLGDTDNDEREQIVQRFKNYEFRYLVNVSVLTTGFDAPHVDVIAILRPTESVSLYQQIVGRGLRLAENKKDCIVLDYAGIGYDIYTPQIADRKPSPESVAVEVDCPACGFTNSFWGRTDDEGNIVEHYGRKCRGGSFDSESMKFEACGFRFRYKLCPQCQSENDIGAKVCGHCQATLVDPETKLKQARLSKEAHVMVPDSVDYLVRKDKNGQEFLEIRYYDLEAQHLSEFYYLNNVTSRKKFHINFLRIHLARPELGVEIYKPEQLLSLRRQLRLPSYIIARKQDRFWRVTEKIFMEELTRQRPRF